MSYTRPFIVRRPMCLMIGLSTITTLAANRQRGTLQHMHENLLIRQREIATRIGTTFLLVQLYPKRHRFTDITPYRVILGVPVTSLDSIPGGLIGHAIPAGDFAMVAHHGRQSGVGKTYHFLYRRGLAALGRQPAGHDVEVWDERSMPERAENALDIYVALRPSRPHRRSLLSDEDGVWKRAPLAGQTHDQ